MRHTRYSDCPEYLGDYALKTRAASKQPHPQSSNPSPERIDEDVPGEDRFSGYDSPRGGPSGNATGSGGHLPPGGGNARGGGDPGDSDCSIPDPPKFPGRGKSQWNEPRKEKYE